MNSFTNKYGPWAIVTGASSGIGAEFARQLAERKMNLVLVARSGGKLEALARELADAHGIETLAVPADLTKADFLDGVAKATADLDVGLLLNNAGYTMTGQVVDLDPAKQLAMVDVNCRAPLALARHFAPMLKERGRGGIVFTSSIMGFGGGAQWATYNATKAFDLLLAEGLATELAGSGVDVQALCPGATHSGFQAAGGADTRNFGPLERLFVMDPPGVVRASLNKLGRRRVVIPGFMNWMMVMSMRWAPRRINTWILSRIVALLAH